MKKNGKPIQFTLHGKPFDPHSSSTKLLLKVIDHLEALPDGSLTETNELATAVGCSTRGLREYSSSLIKQGYAFRIAVKNFYGNQKTIAELAKDVRGEE